ncbi:pentapeptide repeat-containing protein [Campylobacter coli]|nr:pentapeptide repeat-containing protein [Campylobacter coli]
MEEFNKELAQYGIFAKNGKLDIKDNKITIFVAKIEEINFQKLQKQDIKEICIFKSKIKYPYFSKENTIKIDFRNCNFKNQIVVRGSHFENEVIFRQCVFDAVVDFSKTKFKSKIDFSASVFKGEVKFIEAQFLAEKDSNKIIENDFSKTIFERETSFSKAIFQARVSFILSQFKEGVSFIGAQFLAEKDSNKIIENDFRETIFEREVSFDNVIFRTGISFAFSQFKNEVRLSISNFLYAKNMNFIDIVFGKLVLQKELFEKSVNFERCVFLQDINFKDYTFNEITFNTCIFKGNAYFNNSNFTKGVDFHECEFEKTACFYGVKFDETPNFSQALFKSNINIINSNLNFDFTKLDKKIRLLSSQGEGKYDYEIANNFRDSFRNFKSTLIKDNNLLDASNFHKYELYCKEIELKNKKDKTLKDKIDKWQLFFYRKLCDHHTDLLLNLRWLVVVVGFFVSVLFALRYGDGNLLQFFNKDNDLLKMLKAMLNIKVLNDSNVTYLILLYSFIGLFFVRTFFIFYYLVIFILMLAISPYNLFSVVNFVTKDQSSSFLENIIMVAYALIMILVLFSLQKTARKNSIVPS